MGDTSILLREDDRCDGALTLSKTVDSAEFEEVRRCLGRYWPGLSETAPETGGV